MYGNPPYVSFLDFFRSSTPGGSRTWMVCCSLQRCLAAKPLWLCGLTPFKRLDCTGNKSKRCHRLSRGWNHWNSRNWRFVLCLAISASHSFATRCRSWRPRVEILKNLTPQDTSFCYGLHSLCCIQDILYDIRIIWYGASICLKHTALI